MSNLKHIAQGILLSFLLAGSCFAHRRPLDYASLVNNSKRKSKDFLFRDGLPM